MTERIHVTSGDQLLDNKPAVVNPSHYDIMNETAIKIIARSMKQIEFYGFCLGNVLKYRLRAGKKDDLNQDIKKAVYYEKLYEQFKGECVDG